MNQEELDEIKKNTSYLKPIDCTAKICSFWREGNFCVFSGKLEIGGMGTCLSMEPIDDPIIVNPLPREGKRWLP